MANIKNYIENIRSAIFGKEVRGSLADGLDAINKETENTTSRQKHLENTFDQLIINEGNSNAEIVDARVGENGTSFEKLGDRLDNFDTHLAEIMYRRFKGKKYVQIGDSITVGFVDNPYCSIIAKNLGMTLVNLGVSGSAITKTDDRTDSIYERRALIPEDAGIIAIAGGTNDFGHNSPMGSLGQVNSSGFYYNFYGAYYNLVKWIQENRPNAQIILITPTHRENENAPNEQGYILEDYVNVIRDIGNIFSIPVLDFYADGSINPNISQHKSIYATDGLHPLQNWHDILGQKGTIFMRGL